MIETHLVVGAFRGLHLVIRVAAVAPPLVRGVTVADALSKRRNYGIAALLSKQKSILEELRRLDVEVLTENV